MLACAKLAEAQEVHPWSADATVAVGYGSGGDFSGRAGAEAAITVIAAHRGAGIIGASVGGFNSLPYRETCEIRSDWSSNCAPARYPTVTEVGVVGGIEVTRAHRVFRALAGPMVFNGRRESARGGMGQLDATLKVARLALVVALRGTVFPRAPDETLSMLTLGFGVRVW